MDQQRGGGGLPPSTVPPEILNHQKHLFPFAAQNHEPAGAFSAYQTAVQTNQQRPPPSQNSDHQDPEHSLSSSPWQRMKWTDGMVKLLITIVYCIGDDAHDPDGHQPSSGAKKKQSSTPSAALNIMQKKGKWKSVSRAMMERGFYVSPQQCEDKFNDLNKRYKRVTELLGKGTACRVVENQALLESMDGLSPKAKEEARKLLNSKHLFFREMCAYHNGGSGTCSSAQPPPPCFHPTPEEEGQEGKDEEDDFSDEDDGEEEGDDFDGGGDRDRIRASKRMFSGSSMSASPPLSLSLQSTSPVASATMEQLRGEMSSVGNEEEKRKWLKRKAVELEEKKVGYLCQALELGKQRFKWMRYCCNKEREMEKMKLLNERRRLENDRMLLLLRKKEQELVGFSGVVVDHLLQMPLR